MAIISSKASGDRPQKNPSSDKKTDLLRGDAKPSELSRNEEGLRPLSIQDYIGQKALKEVLMIAIQAAKSRQEPLDHLLLYGPPGCGKTLAARVRRALLLRD